MKGGNIHFILQCVPTQKNTPVAKSSTLSMKDEDLKPTMK